MQELDNWLFGKRYLGFAQELVDRRGAIFLSAGPELFRTAWFVESLLTELVVALVVRTYRPFFRSRPGAVLLWSTLVLIPITLAVPYLPWTALLGFVPLPHTLLVSLCAITAGYAVAVEIAKRPFFRHLSSAA